MLASQGFWGTKGEQIKMMVNYHYDFNENISKNRIPLSPPLNRKAPFVKGFFYTLF